jgi:hypothetical protein
VGHDPFPFYIKTMPGPLSTPGVDVRSALAAEQLVVATWALVVVGLLTLIAASLAAYIAFRTYSIESVPSVIIEGVNRVPSDGHEGWPHMLRIAREGQQSIGLTRLFQGPEKPPSLYVSVRNTGRATIVGIAISVRVSGSFGKHAYDGLLRAPSILPQETTYIPIYANEPFRMTTSSVSVSIVAKKPSKGRSKLISFASGEMFYGILESQNPLDEAS